MSDSGYIPEPDSAHPFWRAQADGIREFLDRPAVTAHLPRSRSVTYASREQELEVAPTTITLTVKKCAGPAPFVGDPRVTQGGYVWRVAVDDLGRHVAGPATLSLRPKW